MSNHDWGTYSPHDVKRVTKGPAKAFADCVELRPFSGCWRWTRGTTSDGYGTILHNGRAVPVHRLAYEQLVEPISEDLAIVHRCHERLCCNPEHLRAVWRWKPSVFLGAAL